LIFIVPQPSELKRDDLEGMELRSKINPTYEMVVFCIPSCKHDSAMQLKTSTPEIVYFVYVVGTVSHLDTAFAV
jgi:hypothetical protein